MYCTNCYKVVIPSLLEVRFFDNEDFRNFHSLPDIIRTVKSRTVSCTGHVKWMRDMTKACRLLAETPESKKPLRRPRHRWIILT